MDSRRPDLNPAPTPVRRSIRRLGPVGGSRRPLSTPWGPTWPTARSATVNVPALAWGPW